MATINYYYPIAICFLILFIPRFLLIIRHFIRTRYIASLILIASYGLLITLVGGYIATINIPPESQRLAEIYFFWGFVCILASGALVVYFVESINGHTLSNLTGMITTGCAYLYGAMTNPFWNIEYQEGFGWSFSMHIDFVVYLVVYASLIFGCVFYRLAGAKSIISNLTILDTPSNFRKYAILIAILFIIVPITGIIGYTLNIPYIGMIIFLFTFLCLTVLYCKDPKIFFLNRSTIYNIILMDADSGIPLFILNDPEETELIAATLHGSILAQREISGTLSLPEEYIYGDMAFIMSARKIGGRMIIAILITSKKLGNYRSSLNYLLRKFDETYYNHIMSSFNSIEPYKNFEKQCQQVFDYAIFQSKTPDLKKFIPSTES